MGSGRTGPDTVWVMPVRLIATDLDGTLVRSDGQISERSRQALAAAERAGIDVVFVTGRPLRWAEEVFEHVGAHGHAIVANGALLWDVAGARVAQMWPIEPAGGLDVAETLRRAVPDTHFAVETLSGLALEPGFVERYPVPPGTRRAPLTEVFDAPAVKLLARHELLEPQEFWDLAEEAIGDRVEITWSSSSSLLEISAQGVTKAATLANFCVTHGIAAAEVVAFGDMPNDVAMLRWAGTSYAMANADPRAIAAAARLAPGNDADGVASVVEHLLDTGALPPGDSIP